ncbi:MAG TPA: hypothetical protein VNI84_18785 [Pyrinomonadaceae bacterium]|nr:hypothetical protein [Pyrinomonadaceae bacterium]
MILRFKFFILFAFSMLVGFSTVSAQQQTAEKPSKKERQEAKRQAADAAKNVTAEQVAESTILIYGNLSGRALLNQIRKTSLERGRISVVNAEGKTEQANYERWVLRADALDKERIRFEQEFPNAKYALVYNNDKIFGLYNESVFTPREDALKSFENQIWRGLEGLLRYKENGSTLALGGREKMLGVDFYQVDVTDKQNRKTRYYVSSKSFRVMMLEYTEGETKYRRRFYDYKIAQGTLHPFRSVLWANDKQIEETEVQTITFGQKVEENIFQEG